ncbi:uncharacterized protein LOC125195307 [Salvia hispanica]|uniref:uncharacterized protein LOC125195307 n=1 Tax=Salvia hispanica TaxID=49212 RepID=UPI0020091D28|nr:uncharacterized protein LOC125195307 [Salvia hispanica]
MEHNVMNKFLVLESHCKFWDFIDWDLLQIILPARRYKNFAFLIVITLLMSWINGSGQECLLFLCNIGPLMLLHCADKVSLDYVLISLLHLHHGHKGFDSVHSCCKGICHVEELSVSPNFVLYFSPEFGGYGCRFSLFDSLRCLKIDMKGIVDHVEGLIKLLQHSPNLEALCIQFIQMLQSSRISHWMSREVDVPCLSRNLKEIEIVACRDPVNFTELIKFFLQNGKSLEKINITQKEQRLNLERFYALNEVQLASEAVSVSIGSASACGRKELIKLVYGKCGLSVVTETGISKIRLRRSIRIAAKKSARLVRGK